MPAVRKKKMPAVSKKQHARPVVSKGKEPKFVEVRGKRYAVPTGWTVEECLKERSYNLPSKKLDKVWVGMTRVEFMHKVKGNLFGTDLGFPIQAVVCGDDFRWMPVMEKETEKEEMPVMDKVKLPKKQAQKQTFTWGPFICLRDQDGHYSQYEINTPSLHNPQAFK